MSEPFYITTAIDYINGLPHIGTAYEKITADCIARAKRLLGYNVRFCMGTDEHSINVKKKAIEEGLSPAEYCDRMAPRFEEIWKKLEVSYDDFIRTTEQRHEAAVTELFTRINDAGDIYTADYTGWYCEGCESFIQEKDLVEGKCPTHQTEPAWIEETNYFFRLSKFAGPLLEHINANPDFIRPESRKNEIIRLIEGGLDDISVSRSGFDWGIDVPGDKDHVVYVWFDALINYISSLGFGGDDNGFETYWPADVHVIGKDITRFHCVIWPAMLMSAGIEVPKSVFGHGFIYHRGEKMSKSLGNVVSPLDIADTYGPDPLRYYLLREVVYGQDGDFTWDRFIDRYNSDLANDLGNLLSRTTTMIAKYLDGQFPEDAALPDDGVSTLFPQVKKDWTAQIERYNLSGACESIWELIRAANKRIEETAPWKLAKDPAKRQELVGVLYDLTSVIGASALFLQPYIPSTAASIWTAVGLAGQPEDIRLADMKTVPEIPRQKPVGKTAALFPRIENMAMDHQKESKPVEKEVAQDKPVEEKKDEFITFDDFLKVDMRLGLISSAEKVEGSDKLVRIQMDDGAGGRQILAGIAKHYNPADLVGRQVVFVANLKPRKMMGEMSNGMVLAAGDGEILSVLTSDQRVQNGTKVS